MGRKQVDISTRLSVRECASTFQTSAAAAQGLGSKLGGLAGRLKGESSGLEFYTPHDASPFAQFDDAPSFIVGVRVPRMRGGAAGWVSNIQMSVWDREGQRFISLISEYPMGGGLHVGQLLTKIVGGFKAADNSARVGAEVDV